jgi:hypothetical protein
MLTFYQRLHQRIRNHRRPPVGQDRHPAQRPPQQNRSHLPAVQRPGYPDRIMGQLVVAGQRVRNYHPREFSLENISFCGSWRVDHQQRYPRPRGGPAQERWWKAARLCLLDVLDGFKISFGQHGICCHLPAFCSHCRHASQISA